MISDGEFCGHPGCLFSYPCEGCGRTGGSRTEYRIPASVMRQIYDILLLEVFDVRVSYSGDALEMAQEAIASQKVSVERVLDLINEYCGLGRD